MMPFAMQCIIALE